jgi:hypothetical protein
MHFSRRDTAIYNSCQDAQTAIYKPSLSRSLAGSLRAPPLCIVISSSIKNREVALPDPTAPRPPLCSLRVISSLSACRHEFIMCRTWQRLANADGPNFMCLPLTFVHVYTQTVARSCTHRAQLVHALRKGNCQMSNLLSSCKIVSLERIFWCMVHQL